MSFSEEVKIEIANTKIKSKCCALSELSAFVRINGSMEIGLGAIKVRFDIERLDTAQRIYDIIEMLYDYQSLLIERENKKLDKHNKYTLRVEDSDIASKILKQSGVLLRDNEAYDIDSILPEGMLRKTCCQKAYLKGAFQGAGSISDPNKGYRMEFASRDDETEEHIRKLLHSLDIGFHSGKRRNWYISYINESEDIIKLLAMIGAHTQLLEMENVLVIKDIRNGVNRKVNCDIANITRASNASQKQSDAINKIIKFDKFSKLSPQLKESAEARLNNKEATLDELANLLDISKSGVNHRMRKLVEYAKNLTLEPDIHDNLK